MTKFSIKISDKANEDFEEILHYTLAEYGEKDLEKYADKILNSFHTIKTLPFANKQVTINGNKFFFALCR
jgi:plasmid stabilization system protein ParE